MSRRRGPGWLHRLLLPPCWLLLALTSLAVRLAPFRALVPIMGTPLTEPPWIPLIAPDQLRRARAIRRLLGRSVGFAFWHPRCLSQALTAAIMLRIGKVPYGLYLGMRRNTEGRLTAHAWVCAGPVVVSGGHAFENHAVVRMFKVDG